MARSLHSDKLKESNIILRDELGSDLELLRFFLGKRKIKVLERDDDHIVVPVELNVDLPPRGTYNNVDIRSKENIQIVFNRHSYPDLPPRVYSDRKSFPKDGVAHLYVSKKDAPAPFCLVRGNYLEWFAGKNITDLMIRTENWLRDAASGSLIEDGGQYDPMRLEGYKGSIIYDHEKLNRAVASNITFEKNKNFALLLLKENEKTERTDEYVKYPTYQIVEVITTMDELSNNVKPMVEKMVQNSLGLGIKRMLLGAIVWDESLSINDKFPEYLPKDLNKLIDFCAEYNIDLWPLVKVIPKLKLDSINEFPVIVGVHRPKPIIGYSDNTEFFNFYLTFEEDSIEDNEIKKSVSVGFQSHNQPLTISKAQKVSGSQNLIKNSVVFGCGAVGSKVVTHLIRDGHVDYLMMLFDNDKVEPHNLVRYGLLDESIGLNKAIALRNTAERLFEVDKQTLKILGIPKKGNSLFELAKYSEILEKVDWVMDFTASTAFENYLIKQDMPANNRICKSFITDNGKLGIQLFEGNRRNPRIDDLKIILQSEYLNNQQISDWLKREQKLSKEESVLVNVGVGCNSETTIISDDLISLHSASFVQGIKAQSKGEAKEKGLVRLTSVGNAKGDFSITTESLSIRPLTILKEPKSGWEIRMKAGLEELLMSEMGKAMPSETGGVFIGLINNKTKCIHITDIILAPSDSEANSSCFIRGIEGLKEEVDFHKKKSGHTFGYIGEWHSHPHGPLGPSTKDLKTMDRFKKQYKSEGIFIPILVIIATPHGLIACLH
jgi:integrative and conjugative element protein (TIGR02256 family)